MKQPLIIVFAKNPELGKVKTRLAQKIGPHKALKVYQQLLQKTATVLADIDCTIHLYKTHTKAPITAFESIADFQGTQQGDDLGQRMANAFNANIEQFSPIVLIGTDLWTLQKEDIYEALHALKTHDVVIGPAEDGGYYLLGLKQAYPHIFTNKKWGTATVLNDTRQEIQDEKLYLLQPKNDIDTYTDLMGYPELVHCIE